MLICQDTAVGKDQPGLHCPLTDEPRHLGHSLDTVPAVSTVLSRRLPLPMCCHKPTYVHRVVIACSAKGRQTAQHSDWLLRSYNVQTKMLTRQLGNYWEASEHKSAIYATIWNYRRRRRRRRRVAVVCLRTSRYRNNRCRPL